MKAFLLAAVEAVAGDVHIEAVSELLVMFFIFQEDELVATLEILSRNIIERIHFCIVTNLARE